MKKSILCLAMAFAAHAGAHELDNDLATSDKAAASLPKTTVIRVNNQTKEVEVVHLTARLEAGQKIENVKFAKAAVNTEIAGIQFDSQTEKDLTASTPAWRAGGGFVARGPRGGVVAGGRYAAGGLGYRGGYYGGAGYGYGAGYGGYYPNYGYGQSYDQGYYGGYSGYGYSDPSYYNNSYYSVNSGCYQPQAYVYGGGCGNSYYAGYRVGGYAYVAQPYYYYATPAYSYYYCGQPMLY